MAADEPGLDAFKARLPIAEVVGRWVRLVRRGRDLWGCCPFHSEKTPSFHVVEARGFYHCFGCGAHGNAIDFVMAIEGVDFRTALERLAEITGIPAPRSGERRSGPSVDERLYEVGAAAARLFASWLAGPQGAAARTYLARRGVTAELIDRFGLGYAPRTRDGLLQALAAQGFDGELVLRAGLAGRDEESGALFDRFRERLMFPIHDGRGRVVGFGGRALGEARAKYLNTAETPIFHKSELLFNLHRARAEARRRRELFVVEGYMDVVGLAGIGVPHAVAPLGTAIGETQLALAWQLADEPVLCFDGDAAGRLAARRAALRALPLLRPGKSLRFALLPEGEDPDSLARRHGEAALERLREALVPLAELVWRAELEQLSPTTPERRAAFARRIRELVRGIGDPAVRDQYAQEWFARLSTLSPPRRRGGRDSARVPAATSSDPSRLAAEMRAWEREAGVGLLLPVLRDPTLLTEHEEAFAAVELADPDCEQLRQEILAWYAESTSLDPVELRNHLFAHGFDGLIEGMLADDTGAATLGERREEWLSVLERLERVAAKRREARDIAEMVRDRAGVSSRLASLRRLLAGDRGNDDGSAGSR